MKSLLKRKLFDHQEYQRELMREREDQIKQFQSNNESSLDIMQYKLVETISYEDGSIFIGQLSSDGLRNGLGMLKGADGSVYLGKWKNDQHHEQGIYIFQNGERYEGHIRDGMKQGIGKMFYQNGDKYEGQWLEDEREGFGSIVYANGNKYEGQWKGDVPYGQGTYYVGARSIAFGIWDNTNFVSGKVTTEVYEGQWAYNGPHGKGTYHFQDGSLYSGDWKNGEKDGFGRYQFINGDIYQGEFRCGLKHGKGYYKYATGDTYEGQFFNDYKHGYGIMKFINGDQYKGQWDKDLFHGQGSYQFSTKQTKHTKFNYGQPLNQEKKINRVLTKAIPKPTSERLIESPYVYSPIRTQKDYRMINGTGSRYRSNNSDNFLNLESKLNRSQKSKKSSFK